MSAYQNDHGSLPPAVVYGKDGQALYSWRVLLLPYLEQDDLYKRFNLNEPWDSPNNIRLLSEMPPAFDPPRTGIAGAEPGYTFCRVVVGKGCIFESNDGRKIPDNFPDGSNTILIIEGGSPVPWTKPDSISFDEALDASKLCTVFDDGFRVALLDGGVRLIPKETTQSEMRALITLDGGKPMSD